MPGRHTPSLPCTYRWKSVDLERAVEVGQGLVRPVQGSLVEVVGDGHVRVVGKREVLLERCRCAHRLASSSHDEIPSVT